MGKSKVRLNTGTFSIHRRGSHIEFSLKDRDDTSLDIESLTRSNEVQRLFEKNYKDRSSNAWVYQYPDGDYEASFLYRQMGEGKKIITYLEVSLPRKVSGWETKCLYVNYDVESTLLPTFTVGKCPRIENIDNFSLRFHKAVPFVKRDQRTDSLEFLLHQDLNRKIGSQELLSAVHGRQESMIESLVIVSEGHAFSDFVATADWRWIVGLGNTSVLENGITLHHIYGIPYIPGSSVKGMLRNWLISECFGDREKPEEAAISNPLFQAIFGFGNEEENGGKKGKVLFFDAFPTEPLQVEPDVMNNHYQSYYEGKTPPGDWINPNPIFFLTVKGGTLRFRLGAKTNQPISKYSDDWKLFADVVEGKVSSETTLVDFVALALQKALEWNGIGAKTAVGYGRME